MLQTAFRNHSNFYLSFSFLQMRSMKRLLFLLIFGCASVALADDFAARRAEVLVDDGLLRECEGQWSDGKFRVR
jgi:hypothetical protein